MHYIKQKSLNQINANNYDLDDFFETNQKIINYQEENFNKNNGYKLLSLLCIAFIDLGLIEIT